MSTEDVAEGVARSPLEKLLEVQDLDTGISQLQHRKASLEERSRLSALEQDLAGLERRREAVAAARAELARQQAELEAQIGAAGARHASIEQRLYAGRGTPARDLQAMNEEIGHLDARREQLEDHELEIMVALEPIDAELAQLGAGHARMSEERRHMCDALAASEAAIDAELAEHTASRSAAAATLPEDLRRRYEALRAHLGGTGAARLVANRCGGCHLELPSMEVERIRQLSPGSVVTCEQCGRILVPSPAGTPGGTSAGAPAGAPGAQPSSHAAG